MPRGPNGDKQPGKRKGAGEVMSLGIGVKGPEGVVLATDTRITLTARQQGSHPLNVNFDNATKFLTFDEPHNCVAAVTYGGNLGYLLRCRTSAFSEIGTYMA